MSGDERDFKDSVIEMLNWIKYYRKLYVKTNSYKYFVKFREYKEKLQDYAGEASPLKYAALTKEEFWELKKIVRDRETDISGTLRIKGRSAKLEILDEYANLPEENLDEYSGKKLKESVDRITNLNKELKINPFSTITVAGGMRGVLLVENKSNIELKVPRQFLKDVERKLKKQSFKSKTFLNGALVITEGF